MLLQHSPRLQQPCEVAPFQVWTSPDGTCVSEFFRQGTSCLLRFPGYADFELDAQGGLACWPAPEASEGTLQHLYLNQVLPLLHSREGWLIFHASSVVVNGAAAAFMGRSGKGKSTLAASFGLAGHEYLADDATRIEARSDGEWNVIASQQSLRLWRDSREALDTGRLPEAPAVQFSSKARLLPGAHITFADGPRRLACIYELGGHCDTPTFTELSPAAALVALLSNSFLLDSDLREAVAAHFDRLAAFAENAAVFRVDYPRDFTALPEVRAAIAHHVERLLLRPERCPA